jgi:AraC family transcriptional regulator
MSQVSESCGAQAPREQITGVVAGQIVAVTDAPLLTSAATSWSGFLLETYSVDVVRQDVTWGWNNAHVCLLTRGSINFRVQEAGGQQEFQSPAGGVFVFPRGYGETRFSYAASDFQLICVELDPSRTAEYLGSAGPAADCAMIPQFGLEDPQVSALLKSMAAEVNEGCPSGKLYSQSLSLSLAAYLQGRFSPKRCKLKQGQRRFSRAQIDRLEEYVRANLGGELSLDNLAHLVEMSPRQFFRIFSTTFGSTPHRYIMMARVTHAKALLRAGHLLTEIAASLGFASQSHFTNVFRKMAGISPGRFRQDNRTKSVG